MNCGCGNKMGKYDKVCSSCRDKIRLLGEIREMFYPKKKNKKKKRRIDGRESNTHFQKHPTICWRCEKACGRCSWSRSFDPVKGWEATPTKVLVWNTTQDGERIKVYVDSFDVYSCPEFELLEILR